MASKNADLNDIDSVDVFNHNTSTAVFQDYTLAYSYNNDSSSPSFETSTSYYDYYDNSTSLYDEEYYGDTFHFVTFPFEIIILGMVRPAFVILTTVTNIFVVAYFMTRKNRGRTTSLLFVGIAFSDTMTGLSLIPNSIYVYGMDNYDLSVAWCKFYMLARFYISRVFHTVSLWQMVLLCLQRYMCVCHPFISSLVWTFWKTFVSIVVMYCLSIVLHIYHLVDNKLGYASCRWTLEKQCTKTCVYLWFCAALQHLLPCFLLIVFTLITILELKKANKRVSSMSLRSGNKRSSRDRVITITATLIVIVFLIPELPHGIYKLVFLVSKHEDTTLLDQKMNHIVICLYELLLVVRFNANFWIYCAMMYDFRRAFLNLITCGYVKSPISLIRKFSGSLSSGNGSVKSSCTGSIASRNRVLSHATSIHSVVSDGAHAIVPVSAKAKLEIQRMISQASEEHNQNSEKHNRHSLECNTPSQSQNVPSTMSNIPQKEDNEQPTASEHSDHLEDHNRPEEQHTEDPIDDDVFL